MGRASLCYSRVETLVAQFGANPLSDLLERDLAVVLVGAGAGKLEKQLVSPSGDAHAHRGDTTTRDKSKKPNRRVALLRGGAAAGDPGTASRRGAPPQQLHVPLYDRLLAISQMQEHEFAAQILGFSRIVSQDALLHKHGAAIASKLNAPTLRTLQKQLDDIVMESMGGDVIHKNFVARRCFRAFLAACEAGARCPVFQLLADTVLHFPHYAELFGHTKTADGVVETSTSGGGASTTYLDRHRQKYMLAFRYVAALTRWACYDGRKLVFASLECVLRSDFMSREQGDDIVGALREAFEQVFVSNFFGSPGPI